MPKFERVEYVDGDFAYIGEPPLRNYHIINILHEEMQSLLSGRPAWHPDHVVDGETIADTNLRIIAPFIPKISACFVPEIEFRRMTKQSLYYFFVCTAPFEHEGVMVGGLSGLRSLLGHDIALHDTPIDASKPKHTTGDIVADITASILLSFEGGGMELLNHPLSFCLDVLKQASELSKTNTEKKEAQMLNNAIRRHEALKEKQQMHKLSNEKIDFSSLPEDIKNIMPDVGQI